MLFGRISLRRCVRLRIAGISPMECGGPAPHSPELSPLFWLAHIDGQSSGESGAGPPHSQGAPVFSRFSLRYTRCLCAGDASGRRPSFSRRTDDDKLALCAGEWPPRRCWRPLSCWPGRQSRDRSSRTWRPSRRSGPRGRAARRGCGAPVDREVRCVGPAGHSAGVPRRQSARRELPCSASRRSPIARCGRRGSCRRRSWRPSCRIARAIRGAVAA